MATKSQEVAQTILRQLGGRRFVLMTGARNLMATASGLAFRLPSRFAKKGINSVKIALTPMDTYTVKFLKIGPAPRFNISTISSHDNVYAEDLRRLFVKETGLDVSIGEIRRNPGGKSMKKEGYYRLLKIRRGKRIQTAPPARKRTGTVVSGVRGVGNGWFKIRWAGEKKAESAHANWFYTTAQLRRLWKS